MRAPEFMTSPVVTVSAETPISTASALLLERGFSAMPVVDDEQGLVGIVSESDLLRGRVGGDPRAHLLPIEELRSEPPHTVGEVMTEKVLALPEAADQADFAAAMIQQKFKSIPVVAGRQVVGIVSASDILRTYVRGDEEIARDVGDRLRTYAGGQFLWSVHVSDAVVTLSGQTADPHGRVAVLLAETVPGVARVRLEPVASDPGVTRAVQHQGEDIRGEVPRDHRGLRVLGVDECLERLRTNHVGRLAFVDRGELVVLPVNHALDQLDIVFRTTWGSKLQAAESAQQVAFQADGTDEIRQLGWSVLAKGIASVIYEDSIIDRLESLELASWAPGDQEAFWVRVRVFELTGREILPSSLS